MASAATPDIPSHVPPELVRDLSLSSDPEVLADPWAAIDRLREESPLVWLTEFGGYWIVTSADLVREVLQTPEVFDSYPAGIPPINAWPRPLIPLELNGDAHTRYRRLLTPLFSPRAIRPLADSVRERATQLITSFASADRVEFQSRLSHVLPPEVFLKLFGVPVAQSEMFRSWADDMLHSGNPETMAAAGASLIGYLTETIADRTREPTDDMISELIKTEVEGRPLTAEEVLDISFLLILAGMDTVANQLGVMMLHLARDPELQQALRDDSSLIDAAVEELFRLRPVAPPARTLRADYVLNGVQLKEGDRLLVTMMGANRDPALFDNPDQVRLDREENWTAGFGLGPHRCLGMHLARQEMRIVLELMTTLAPPFRVATGTTPQWRAGLIWGLDHLDLEFVRDTAD